MIFNTLQNQIGDAMKARDEVRVSTLRMLSSAFNYEKINLQHDLTDEEELVVIAREAKKRKEAVEAYKKAGADEKAQREKNELKILQTFLPKQISDEELAKIVDEVVKQTNSSSMADMGKVIGAVKAKVGATAEGSKIAELTKKLLS